MVITEYALTLVEKKRLRKWLKVHNTKCEIPSNRRDISLIFSPGGGIGVGVYAQCSCGRKKELTDYGSW